MTCERSLWIRIVSVAAVLLSSTLVAMGQNPVPFINQPLVPSAFAPAPPGLSFALTINGSGFVTGSKLNWNGSPRTTVFVSHSRLVAHLLSSDLARPGTAWITVVNPTPGGGTSNTVFLPVHSPIRTLSFSRTGYYLGGGPMFLATADFRRVGKLDLVVADHNGAVWVLLGNGDGTFHSPTSYPAVACAQGLTVGDFNRDGKLDLAVLGCGMAVLLGNGDGTFQPPIFYPTDASTQVVTADFRGNGKLDLAASGSGVSILLGNGDGTFQPAVDYGTGDFTTGVAVGDFNGDGKLDVAVSNYSTGNMAVLVGNGDGTFRSPVFYPTDGCTRTSLMTADLNGDGKLDLAPGSTDCGTVAFLFGNGDGTFRRAVEYVDVGAGLISVGDFNADGKVDFAALTLQPTIDIALGNGNGTFQPPLSFVASGHPWDVLPADFNGDGRLDFVYSDFNGGTIYVFLAQPTGAAKAPGR